MKLSLYFITLVTLSMAGCGGQMASTGSNSSLSSSSSGGLSSSSSGGPNRPNERILAELQTQRELWQAHGILEYEVGFSAQYGNSQRIDVIMRVKEGTIVSVKQRDGETEAALPSGLIDEQLVTIEESFEDISAAATVGFYQLNVEFDSNYGFPVHVYRDYRSDWFDDQDQWSYSDFVMIR